MARNYNDYWNNSVYLKAMLRSYKYRLYPNKGQEILLNKHFGACRFIYNLALETKQMAWLGSKANISGFDLVRQMTELKKECPWLKETYSQSLQSSIMNLDKAYTGFLKAGNGYPAFKSKHKKQSIQYPQNVRVDFNDSKIHFPKFSSGITAIFDRRFVGGIKTVTISKTPTGKYFASVLVDNGKENPTPTTVTASTSIGIDLGLKSFAITSEGETFDNPKYFKTSLARLKVLQRRLSKKKKGSANRQKAKHKVALLHEKIANQRKDFLHKISSKLISENQTICIEDLNVAGIVKNHCLAQSVSDVGWGEFERMLKYKALWYGKNLLQIGTFEPSSKTCSDCGAINDVLSLKDREWVCANCGVLHERDINAAKNIKAFALKNSGQGVPGGPVELPTLVGAVKQEYIG